MNYAGDGETTKSAMCSMSSNMTAYACSASNDQSTLMFSDKQRLAAMAGAVGEKVVDKFGNPFGQKQ
jgi:hypothetical protein